MIYLSIEDDTKDLYLFINSPGGWVIPGVAIYDTMQFVRPDVHTICMGLAASMGSFILVGGEITKRLAFPHAWRQWGFYLREIKKTMPSPYEIWILSNNSMALRIRYEKFLHCQKIRLCIERVVWEKGYFRFSLIYRESTSASQTFLFLFWKTLNNIYVM